ncbi:hypothetical protein CRENBAI_020639 [Crenichthys baileyi]|uniref:Uncharacterized protein n=1 Tax=Crenichthys baileyi TaxID=28760 RepID=A0AAV9RTW8_9TELE
MPAPAPINPQDPTSNPSPDPDQKASELLLASNLRWQIANGVWKDPKPTSARSNVVLMRVVVESISKEKQVGKRPKAHSDDQECGPSPNKEQTRLSSTTAGFKDVLVPRNSNHVFNADSSAGVETTVPDLEAISQKIPGILFTLLSFHCLLHYLPIFI